MSLVRLRSQSPLLARLGDSSGPFERLSPSDSDCGLVRAKLTGLAKRRLGICRFIQTERAESELIPRFNKLGTYPDDGLECGSRFIQLSNLEIRERQLVASQ